MSSPARPIPEVDWESCNMEEIELTPEQEAPDRPWDRLEANGQPPKVDWETINSSVQDVLQELAAEVQRRRPEIQPRFGRTLTHLLLFSYCAFETPSASPIDPVIAGIDFRSQKRKAIVVRADLSGEESGKIWVELPEREVPEEQEAIRTAGVELARQLVARIDEVHAALQMRDSAVSP